MVTLTVISIFLLVGLVAYSLYLIAQSRKGHKLEEGFININETKVWQFIYKSHQLYSNTFVHAPDILQW